MKFISEASSFLEKNKERTSSPKTSMHSLELVITIIMFVLIGTYLDSRMQTSPLFTLIFSAVGIIGSFATAFYRYKSTSEQLEDGMVWSSKKKRVAAPIEAQEQEELVIPKGYGQDD